MNGASAQMPKYKCHKEVWALKIRSVLSVDGGSTALVPEDPRYANIQVDSAYVEKHKPEGTGYYVVYEGGYKSWSPVEAFEKGYSLCES